MAKKTKLPPEIICLSDDDDDVDHNSKINTKITTPVKEKELLTTNNSNKYEPSNWIIQDKDIIHVSPLPSKYSDIYKKPFEIRCSSVRFGITEFNIDSEIVLMKETEFEMNLSKNFMDNLSIKLAYSDVVKFYFSFESQTPAAFIHVRNEFAVLFDKFIPTSDEHGKGFNPNSKDEKRRHIIFCLKALTPDMERIHIATIFYFLKTKSTKIDVLCISGTRADELYSLARYAKTPTIATPKKILFTLNTNDLTAKTVGLNNNTIRFDLSSDDLHCLNEGEFLNDNIIDFYLQYIYYEKLSADDREYTHLFNSFFYTRLTQKGNRDNPDICAAERRYNRVKRWVRDVDLFTKNYIIVPVNQNTHWYIVLIQNLNNVPTEGDLISDDEEDTIDDRLKSKKRRRSSRIIRSIGSNSTSSSPSPKPSIQLGDELDEADEVTSDNEVPLKQNIEALVSAKKDHSQTPAIIIFDSLRIASKNRVAATLREFLQVEYDHKKALPVGSLARKLFNMNTMPTIEAAVPQQRNYSDCGLYILQYIESYFTHLTSTFTNWCEKNLKGSTKRKEILTVINQHVINKEV
ncbi:unnamed protein product [Adineta steineri]|uniref:Ubiquitin-like protease family profile domain-containing protein n=1 Tax=Adineta steineri TaxID=433720 RepID=A0A814VQU0_9BILA|nr:unnamed protein product [Adineta steineri]